MSSFLCQVLAPFWEAHVHEVRQAMLPHHALAVSRACARSQRLPQDVFMTVSTTLCAPTEALKRILQGHIAF